MFQQFFAALRRSLSPMKQLTALSKAKKYQLCLMWSWPGFQFFKSSSIEEPTPRFSLEMLKSELEEGKFTSARKLLDEESSILDSEFELNCLKSYIYFKLALIGDDQDQSETSASFAEKTAKCHSFAKKAVETDPNSAEANKMMGLSLSLVLKTSFPLHRRFKLGTIIKYLETAVKIDDSDWETHYYLGSHYLETIRSITPIFLFTDRYILGVPYASYNMALEHLLKAEQLKPNCSCGNLTKLALLYYKRSEYENAKLYIEKAVNFKCKNAADSREKEEAAQVLVGWAKFTQFFKTVNIN